MVNIIWHYTTWSGLEGILTDHELWASRIGYLNDEQEFVLAQRVFRAAVKKAVGPKNLHKVAAQIGRLERAIRRLGSHSICVTSFSYARDSLSQWRAYASQVGFSVGFDPDKLVQAAMTELQNFKLVDCIYGAQDQFAAINGLVSEFLEFCSWHEENDLSEIPYEQIAMHDVFALNRLAQKMAWQAPQIKHGAFREERECRLVSLPLAEPTNLGFHRSGSMVVPHTKIDLGSRGASPIVRIDVGPGPHADRVVDAVQLKALKCGLSATVSASKIPYRNW
jgi:hypothetical protein